MLESTLRNAARRAAVKFFVSGIDINHMGNIVNQFENQLREASDDTYAYELSLDGGCVVWEPFANELVSELYDYYHFLVEDFVKEAMKDAN